jgi:hypothetical protein
MAAPRASFGAMGHHRNMIAVTKSRHRRANTKRTSRHSFSDGNHQLWKKEIGCNRSNVDDFVKSRISDGFVKSLRSRLANREE